MTRLQEQKGVYDSWTVVGTGPAGTSQLFNAYDYPDGLYSYRLMIAEPDPNHSGRGRPPMVTRYTPVHTVTVGDIPALPNTLTQETYQYEVKTGDINFDGHSDFFVSRTSGGNSNDGAIYQTILRQLGDGSFEIFTATSSQISTASTWPSANVSVDLVDLNADAVVDLVLRGVENLNNVTRDVVLFATGEKYATQALSATVIDEDVTRFFTNLDSWLADDQYFDDRYDEDTEYFLDVVCGYVPALVFDHFGDFVFSYTLVFDCWDVGYEREIITIDPQVNPSAMVFAENISGWVYGNGSPSNSELEQAVELLAGVIGAPLGRRDGGVVVEDTYGHLLGYTGVDARPPIILYPAPEEDLLNRRVGTIKILKVLRPWLRVVVTNPVSVAIGGVLLPTQAGNGSLPVPFPDADRSDDDKWVRIGVSIGTNNLARNKMNDPDAEWRAVIGEIETPSVEVYLFPGRIENVAIRCAAVFFPDFSSVVDTYPQQDRDGIYQALNLGWIWGVVAMEATIIDLGNVAERQGRGAGYRSERHFITQYGTQSNRWEIDVIDTFDHNVYRSDDAQDLKYASEPPLPCET